VVVQADIADADAVRVMVDDAANRLGGLDVLVNNAASYGRVAHPIGEVSYELWQQAWRQTIDLNLIGAANVTWCAVRHMIAAGGGRIVNVSSRGAFRGEPAQPAYGASKAGLNARGGRTRFRGDGHGRTAPGRRNGGGDPRPEPLRPGSPT
jgi:NAD(P)-dependent dehydrogenase (short-subunit alcohol dehydrogenase family)